MNVEGTDYFQGLDVMSELVVSRCGFNPDDLFAVRACPGCGRQPAEVCTTDLAGNGRFKVVVQGFRQDPVELPGTELLYCRCKRCHSIYSVVMFGPGDYDGAIITEYLIVRQDGFLKNAVRELEAMARKGERPGDVDDWIASRLTGSIDRALAGADSELCMAVEEWNESRYRKKWIP